MALLSLGRLTLVALAGACLVPTALAGGGVAPGALVVGMHLPDPGFQVGAVRGDRITYAAGFEADLVRILAPRLGAPRPTLVQVSRNRLTAPGPKKWEIAVARLVPGTRGAVRYSIPYLRGDPVVLVRRRMASPRSLAALAGTQLCTTAGSRGRGVIASRIRPAATPIIARDDRELLTWIRTGRCDAALREGPELGAALDGSLERTGRVVGVVDTGQAYAIALPRRSALLAPVNRALGALRASGRVHALALRWLGFDPNRLRILS